MTESLKIADIYDKNLNFLIGSGASYGLFPTLALNIKNDAGASQTIETLATLFSQDQDRKRHTLLFMHYYSTCIKPVIDFTLDATKDDAIKTKVISNYEAFVNTVLQILQRRQPLEKRCNIFTTNYDGCFAHVADRVLRGGALDFVLNDGTRGFSQRFLQARNFNSFLCQTGVFERNQYGIPQINLIHVHGSVYWNKDDTSIRVDYASLNRGDVLPNDIAEKLIDFSSCLMDAGKLISDLPTVELSDAEINTFWEKYDELPIVNPTKWKFHETVFEEHYYQMLRLLSYELEKPNAVLVTFGFSFADEHILNLVKRSLSNPSLQVFICCFDAGEQKAMREKFSIHRNVDCVAVESGVLDFSIFNQKIFTLNPVSASKGTAESADAVAEVEE